jgi:hypothetical protein
VVRRHSLLRFQLTDDILAVRRSAPCRAVPCRAAPCRAVLCRRVSACAAFASATEGRQRRCSARSVDQSIGAGARTHSRTRGHAPPGVECALASMRACALSAPMPSMNARVAARSCSRLWSRKRRSRSPCASTRCASARSAAQRALPSRPVPHLYQDRAHYALCSGCSGGMRGRVVCLSVCLFVCLFVCIIVRSVRSVLFVCLFFCLFVCLFASAQVGALQMIGLTPVRVLEALQARPRAASIGRACACARNALSSVWRAPRSLTPTPAAAGVCRGDGRAAAPSSVHRTGDVGLGRSGEVGDVCEGLSGKALSGTAAKRDSGQAGER